MTTLGAFDVHIIDMILEGRAQRFVIANYKVALHP